MVIGAIVITAISFVLGYFLGYKGGGVSEGNTPAPELVNEGEAVRPEERRVMELSTAQEAAGNQQDSPASAAPQSGQVTLSPPISPGEIVPEVVPSRPSDAVASGATGGQAQGREEPEKSDRVPERTKDALESQGTEFAGERQGSAAQKAHPVKGAAEQKTGKQGKERTVRKASPSEKMYTVQVGAFPSREGAVQLLQNLQSRGYKPYIVDAGQGDTYFRVRLGAYKDRKEAERNAVAFSKKTGLPNFVTLK
ncbi:MAG: SPOR domain-containing protein [Alphaproteobacteria bacterium]|uniref:SPOR domain-containing protein n=1 Tax=Candidatus Nitrobium versatile TaxID=2884831 RepID=A0A953J8R0_9BACT|nr:SPOR domain-containing protein [Candidatus Nitrobium versatile]